jgi:hypothetical protein
MTQPPRKRLRTDLDAKVLEVHDSALARLREIAQRLEVSRKDVDAGTQSVDALIQSARILRQLGEHK